MPPRLACKGVAALQGKCRVGHKAHEGPVQRPQGAHSGLQYLLATGMSLLQLQRGFLPVLALGTVPHLDNLRLQGYEITTDEIEDDKKVSEEQVLLCIVLSVY